MPEEQLEQLEQLEDKILEKIKDTKPKPKWEFLLKDSVIWFFIFFSLLVGSFASSVIIFMIDNNDWDLYKEVSNNFWSYLLATLPYFWLVLLVLFIGLLYYNFINTKTGYKYNFWLIICCCVFISIALGIIFYNLGLAHCLNSIFNEKVPYYQKMMERRNKVFAQPEQGMLTGRVLYIEGPDNFMVLDLYNHQWRVWGGDFIEVSVFSLRNDWPVLIWGEKLDDENFQAEDVKPLMCREQHCMQQVFFVPVFFPR